MLLFLQPELLHATNMHVPITADVVVVGTAGQNSRPGPIEIVPLVNYLLHALTIHALYIR